MLLKDIEINKEYNYKLGLQDDYTKVKVVEKDSNTEDFDYYDVAVKANNTVFWCSSDELVEII